VLKELFERSLVSGSLSQTLKNAKKFFGHALGVQGAVALFATLKLIGPQIEIQPLKVAVAKLIGNDPLLGANSRECCGENSTK
jgi:hypothetical protein